MRRLLIVEDSPVDVYLMELILKRMGFDYVVLENGDAALDLLERETFSLVTTGMLNPGKMGLELIRAVHERCPQTPILVLTGADGEELACEAIQAGASMYMKKRHWFEDLPPVLRSILPDDEVVSER